MSGLLFGGYKVTHHCARESETRLNAIASDAIANPDHQIAAAILVQSCLQQCKSICPADCELKNLAGLDEEQLQSMLRMNDL